MLRNNNNRNNNNNTSSLNAKELIEQFSLSTIPKFEPRLSENLSDLSKIDTKTILRVLNEKFNLSKFYTEASINTLIAINPFQDKPDLYSVETMNFYSKNFNNPSLPAHIYKHSLKALKINSTENQTILVSGDSGSGKTRSINFIIAYYSHLSSETNHQIKNILLNTNRILESFGNAQTLLNDNSSRFGKYIKLYFNSNTNQLVSASLKTYLLEKTRSTLTKFNTTNNFNFHIFYELLLGSSESERKLFSINQKLLNAYSTLNSNDFSSKLRQLAGSFELIDLNHTDIFRLIVSLAHLNCCLIDSKTITTNTLDHFECAARLLDFSANDLNSYLFVHELSISHSNDIIKKPCNLNQINQRKNCLIKLIYNELFKFIVKKINLKLNTSNLEALKETRSIGLLDIYGFECNPDQNSLEQLCINYTNEKLQKIFFDSYFKLNKFELEAEFPDFDFKNMLLFDYKDNLSLLNIFETSLFSLLNEQTILTNHDYLILDNDLLLKIKQINSDELIHQPIINSKCEFFINHYAGVVSYKADELVTKNNDHIPDDLVKLLLKSKNSFLVDQVLQDYLLKMKNLKNPKKPTVLSKFKTNLDNLISSLSKSNIFYVRCIKPNMELRPDYFDFDLVRNQLESCGIIALLNLSKQGFLHKFYYQTFCAKYKPLKVLYKLDTNNNSNDDFKQLTKKILNTIGSNESLYKLGLTKVFLKENLFSRLNLILEKCLNKCACLIQSKWKCFRERRRYLVTLKSIKIIQHWWREHKPTESSLSSSLSMFDSCCSLVISSDNGSYSNRSVKMDLDLTTNSYDI